MTAVMIFSVHHWEFPIQALAAFSSLIMNYLKMNYSEGGMCWIPISGNHLSGLLILLRIIYEVEKMRILKNEDPFSSFPGLQRRGWTEVRSVWIEVRPCARSVRADPGQSLLYISMLVNCEHNKHIKSIWQPGSPAGAASPVTLKKWACSEWTAVM